MRVPFHLPAGSRAASGIALMALLVLVAASLLFVQAGVSERVERAMEAAGKFDRAVSNLRIAWQDLTSTLDHMLLTRQPGLADRRLAEDKKAFKLRFEALARLDADIHSDGRGRPYSFPDELGKLEKELEVVTDRIVRRVREGRWARAQVLRHIELASLQRRFNLALGRLESHMREDVRILTDFAHRKRTQGRIAASATAIGAILLGLLVWLRFERGVNRPVRALAETARAVHAGNIRVKADAARAGELREAAEAFNAMTDRLAEALDGLKFGEERFRLVLDELPIPTAVIALDGDLEFMNTACAETLGYAPEDLPNMASVWGKVYPDPAYRDLARRSWTAETRAARTTGKSIPARVWKLTTAGGDELDMEFHTAVLPDRAVITMVDITERLAGNTERDQLAAVLEGTTDLVSTGAPDGKLIFLNRAGREMVGWPVDLDITGAIIPDLHPPHAMEIIDRIGIPSAVRDGVWRGETALRHADGHDIPVSQVIIAHTSETGELEFLSTVMRDITEDKRAEEELAKSNAMLTSVIDQAPFGIMVAEGSPEKWRMTMINREAERINGVPAEEQCRVGIEDGRVVGSEFLTWRMFRPDGTPWPPPEAPLPLAMQGEVTRNREMTVRASGGRESTVLCNSSPIRDHIGNVIAAVVIFSDITEMKDAQREMFRLRNYLADILDSMPSVIIGVDDMGRVTQFNRNAELETGLEAGEVIGRDVAEVVPRLEEFRGRIRDTVNSGRPYVHAKHKVTEKGRVRFEDLTIFPLYGKDESGAVIRIDDVTDRAGMEEIMIQSEKMMSVGGLAAGMAHEINNPLGIILQGVQSAHRRLAPDLSANKRVADELDLDLVAVRAYMEARNILQYLDGIETAGHRAAKIVRNMLDFSRKSESKTEDCSLPKLIDTVVELAAGDYDLKKKFDFRRITVNRQYSPDTPKIACIRTELEQVILNLLKNAAQAMKEIPEDHEPSITLRTYPSRDMTVIEVEDNGPGMAEDIRKRIFEPFFTTKAPGSGTGLGLAVSYFIITNNHAGEFLADSAPGKGTKFTIRLPSRCRVR